MKRPSASMTAFIWYQNFLQARIRCKDEFFQRIFHFMRMFVNISIENTSHEIIQWIKVWWAWSPQVGGNVINENLPISIIEGFECYVIVSSLEKCMYGFLFLTLSIHGLTRVPRTLVSITNNTRNHNSCIKVYMHESCNFEVVST